MEINKSEKLKEFELGNESLQKIKGGELVITGGILVGGGNVWCNSDEGTPPNNVVLGHDCCVLDENGNCISTE